MSENGPRVQQAKLSDFVPDDKNANKGTERGRYMLETSLERVGAGRGIVVDRNGKVIAGNKTQEVAIASGIEDAIVVETEGDKLVITKRLDMDLDDPDPNNPARQYAYLDNRAGEVGLEWDTGQIQLDLDAGFDFSAMFRENELDIEWGDNGSALDPTAQTIPEQYVILVECESEHQQAAALELLTTEGYPCRALLS